jgi:hypothetical protein
MHGWETCRRTPSEQIKSLFKTLDSILFGRPPPGKYNFYHIGPRFYPELPGFSERSCHTNSQTEKRRIPSITSRSQRWVHRVTASYIDCLFPFYTRQHSGTLFCASLYAKQILRLNRLIWIE